MNAKEFIQKLTNYGYNEFKSSPLKNANRNFQKRVKQDSDTKYFITIYYYEFQDRESFEIDLQFNKIYKGKPITINTTLFSIFDWDEENMKPDFHDIDLIEEYIEEFFNINKFEYYERY